MSELIIDHIITPPIMLIIERYNKNIFMPKVKAQREADLLAIRWSRLFANLLYPDVLQPIGNR